MTNDELRHAALLLIEAQERTLAQLVDHLERLHALRDTDAFEAIRELIVATNSLKDLLRLE